MDLEVWITHVQVQSYDGYPDTHTHAHTHRHTGTQTHTDTQTHTHTRTQFQPGRVLSSVGATGSLLALTGSRRG